jgi:acyl-CoA reductase-like NAD-dependent aldehyde dehydrogenase
MAGVEERVASEGPKTNGSPGSGEIAVQNPATGQEIRRVPELSTDQVAELARRARAAQPGWNALGFEGRARVLSRAQKWVVDNRERISRSG